VFRAAGDDVKGRRATGARADFKDIMAVVSRRVDCENILIIVQFWIAIPKG
jgi:hypothetical protein